MGLWHTARDIYLAIKDDDGVIATIRAERSTLAQTIATSDSGGLDFTSATVNGQSYSGSRSITQRQRLSILTNVLAMVDAGGNISSRTTPVFPGNGSSE